jgi:transcriptional regulator with PAS, ATPase and Fis domain
MNLPDWLKQFAGAVTVCDAMGIILYINDKSAAAFVAEGGLALIGKNLLDCHPLIARQKLEQLMLTRATNVYTIEKNGVKKLVHQSPFYQDGQYAGFIELVLEIPFTMPYYVRG